MMIITDSASDITKQEALEMNIRIVSLKIRFSDGEFHQNTKEVLVITLSSGLSGTVNAANLAKQMAEYEKIWIVDSEQAIITQRFLVQRAVKMRKEGTGVEEIVACLEDLKKRLAVCGMLNTLTYLKKGGRIPAPLAVLGNALQIKPVIELKDKVLVMLGKARGQKGGMKYLWKEFGSYEIDKNEPVYFGYTSDKEIVEQFMEKTVAEYGLKKYEIYPVGGIIGTHVGPGCIAISFVKKEKL